MKPDRSLFVTAALANVLVLVVPGGWMLVEVFWIPGPISQMYGDIGLGLAGLFGPTLLLAGFANLLCLLLARASPRVPTRQKAIGFGVLLCVALGFAGILLSARHFNLLPAFMLTGVAFLTIMALAQLRPSLDAVQRCPHCSYDMTGLPSDVCPECGRRPGDEKSPA